MYIYVNMVLNRGCKIFVIIDIHIFVNRIKNTGLKCVKLGENNGAKML